MLVALGVALLAAGSLAPTPEERAIAYLAREVPAWRRDNGCYSCHNNGDAARALYVARRLGWHVPGDALRGTTDWLARPSGWENNRGDPRFSDKKLARLQFAAALAEATDAGLVGSRAALGDAAGRLAREQEPDGCWQVEAEAGPGSPVTYGSALATALARDVLRRADSRRFRDAIRKAEDCLAVQPLASVTGAAAVGLALRDRGDAPARRKVADSLELIRQAQASDGGWGPVPGQPAEPFDTAVALLALSRNHVPLTSQFARGRDWLVRAQLPDGGWPATTRPPGGQSYAQHVSTSGWAALALLATRDVER